MRRAGVPLRRKPRRQESALYLHLLADSDIHLPVFRSADLHRRTTIANRDYGEITGGQNALTAGYVNHPDASPGLAFSLWDYFRLCPSTDRNKYRERDRKAAFGLSRAC